MSTDGNGIGGITELQLLQADIALLQNQLEGINQAPTTSSVAPKIMACIAKHEDQDGFVGNAGTSAGGGSDQHYNQYHSNPPSGESGGCCTVQ